MHAKQSWIALGGTAFLLFFLVFLGTRLYGGSVSALLHMDTRFAERHRVPGGIVLYEDAGYDGMLYYQVARDIPKLLSGEPTSLDSPYRFQRILLPLLAYVFTFGNEHALPYTFLAINLAAALGALALMMSMTWRGEALGGEVEPPPFAPSELRRGGQEAVGRRGSTSGREASPLRVLHALAVVANPAILVGILFSLTEPLSLFFVVLFFHYWMRNRQRLNVISLAALTLSILARETTVFLVVLLFLWFLLRKQWKEMLLAVVPLFLFVIWQGILSLRFGSIPFQMNSTTLSLPLSGLVTLLRWSFQDLNPYRLSSLGFLFFFIPLCLTLGREWMRKGKHIGVFCFLLSGLCAAMLTLDAHMWGVITSIGRVVPPLYPSYALYAAERDTWRQRLLSTILIVISVIAALGIASVRHPFTFS